ncbi:MAG: NAD(P)/FAD-dependent oxidoreductase [Gammaproteobacteria bacterium]
MYDLIIIGGGPAGLTAAVYALHKRIETLLISEDLGGKVNYHLQLKGLEGHEVISGAEVVEKFKRRLEYLQFAHRIDRVCKIEPLNPHFAVLTQSGHRYETRSIVIAAGATPQRLDVPGEARLVGRGLSYSAISHAQLFIEKTAAVYGSSGRALRAVAELASVADHVHLLLPEPGDMDSALGKKLRAHSRVTVHENAVLREIRGTEFVESLVVQSGPATEEIPVDGLFVELGLTPHAQFAADLAITDSQGRIVVDSKCATSHPGVFAAGDVTDVFVEQVLICIGEGAKAALSAYEYLL